MFFLGALERSLDSPVAILYASSCSSNKIPNKLQSTD